jgi:hypothetical protein
MLSYTCPKLAFFLIQLRAVATSRLRSNCKTGRYCCKDVHTAHICMCCVHACICMGVCMPTSVCTCVHVCLHSEHIL